jgi:hypothetical protein
MTVMVGQEMQMVRRIYMTDQHPKDVKPSFYGDSIGHWEDDTLIVDTIGIRGSGRGVVSGETRHIVERIKKSADGMTLTATQTAVGGSGGGGRGSEIYWNPNRKFMEWICEDADEFWDPNYK